MNRGGLRWVWGNSFFCWASALVLLERRSPAPPSIRALRPYLKPNPNRQWDERAPIRVIAKFKDKIPLPDLPHSAANHRAVELAMLRNARASQQPLARFAESAGGLRSQSLWLFNAAIVDLPAGRLKSFVNIEGLASIVANRKIRLAQGQRAEFNKALNEAPATYTYGLKFLQIPQLLALFPNLNGTGVKVGIIDSGMDASHSALAGPPFDVQGFRHEQARSIR